MHSLDPSPRSAHCLLARPSGELLAFGGDTGLACQRLNDLWRLRVDADQPERAAWQPVQTAGPAPQPRSNCAAAVVGSRLFVFGGWDAAGTTPLAEPGVLELRTLAWLPPDVFSGEGPSPRGQPTLCATTAGDALLAFGGWDGRERYNDLHRLDLATLTWSLMTPAPGKLPPARADHSCCTWRYCDDGVWKDLLVCCFGSTAAGVQADVWLFDTRLSLWTEAFCAGAAPCARSSHAAAIANDSLVVVGGQAGGAIFADCHLLHLTTLTWQQVEVPGLPPLCRHAAALSGGALWLSSGFDGERTLQQLLRLQLGPLVPPKKGAGVPDPQLRAAQQQGGAEAGAAPAAVRSGLAGGLKAAAARLLGWDGREQGADKAEEAAAEQLTWFDVPQLKAAALPAADVPASSQEAASSPGSPAAEAPGSPEAAKQAPFCVADLPPEERQLAGWRLVRKLHAAAVAAGHDMYVDPASGYTVFTARYLERRPCCGNKCRHCPWGHANVKPKDDW